MRHRELGLFALIGLLICGCSDALGTVPVPSSTNVYWELRLNHHAILLSLRPPHNTLRLQTTLYTAFGEPWAPDAQTITTSDTLPSPVEFVSRDSTKVLVSSNGIVTARSVTDGNVYVIATRKLGNSEHVDSALIRVTDIVSPPVLGTFRVRPASGDSAKLASDIFCGFGCGQATKYLVVTTKDTSGAEIENVPIYFTSSNPFVATTRAFEEVKSVVTVQPGEVVLRSETWVYGVARQDSLVFIVGYPIAPNLFTYSTSRQRNNLVWNYGPGATVAFFNSTGATTAQVPTFAEIANNGVHIDIIFDDSINVLPAESIYQNTGGGNIYGIPGDTLWTVNKIRYRRFLTPGTYVYRILPLNTTGTIVIHDK